MMISQIFKSVDFAKTQKFTYLENETVFVTHPALERFQPEGHWKLHNKARSLSPAKCLVGFEPATSDSNCNDLTC